MAIAARIIAFLVLATALSACGSKPAVNASGAGAHAADPSASGTYRGVPVYPGMTELTTHDAPAAPGATLHSGSYRSNDKQDQIRAYYREQLGKLSGNNAQVSEDTLGDGMVRLIGGTVDNAVTILIHPGDSGEQIVGIQVISKD